MVTNYSIAIALSAGLATMSVDSIYAQDFPNKPIRLITTTVGSGSDFTSRFIAQGISGPLGQPVVVDNRTGTLPSIDAVVKAAPDGYSLLVSGGTFWITPLLQKTSYDAVADFVPVTLTDRSANVLVVDPSLPVKSVKELIAFAKAHPGQLNMATGQTGSSGHLAGELFKAMADVNIVRVPYKGSGPAVTALLGGEVQMLFANDVTLTSNIKSGKLRALAITSAEPSPLFPGLPTIAASGLPGYESISITGVFAPAKTPVSIINRLNQEMARVLHTTDAKEKFMAGGQEPVGSSPEELGAAMKADIARMGKVIKDAGIKAD